MYRAALIFAPIVLVLREAFGSLVTDTDVNGISRAARFLAASSIVAICASMVGVMLVDLSSLWMCRAAPVIQSAIASGATLVVFRGGAAFGSYTGRVRQAPRWMMKICLEWLLRFCMEPWRLGPRYLRNYPVFLRNGVRQLTGVRNSPWNRLIDLPNPQKPVGISLMRDEPRESFGCCASPRCPFRSRASDLLSKHGTLISQCIHGARPPPRVRGCPDEVRDVYHKVS
jgi:hypothetical protein